MLFYVLNTQFPIKSIIDLWFCHCRWGQSFLTSHCDVTTVDLWHHANVGYWHCEVIFIDCSWAHNLGQRWSSLVGLRPVIQIFCHILARGWGRWLRYFTEAKAEVKYRVSARIRGPKHDTRFEWPVSILIMTRHPFLPIETHKTSAKNHRLLTIAGAISFCRYRQCKPSQLWMHAPVAKERRLMTSQCPIFDRTDNLNPQWMQAVNG